LGMNILENAFENTINPTETYQSTLMSIYVWMKNGTIHMFTKFMI